MGAQQKRIEISVQLLRILASRIWIKDHLTGRTIRWVPNEEQIEAWELLCAGEDPFTFFLKSRQVGLSLAILFYDVVWAWLHDCDGNPVKVGLYWDTDDKLKEQMKRAHGFVRDLGIPCTPLAKSIRFANGSEIVCRTAGGVGTGRSESFDRYHCSEGPWWRDAATVWNGIQNALNMAGECTIETTMDPKDPTFGEIWDSPSNGFTKVFFPFEMHEEYRMDPDALPEEEWKWMQSEGFTDRSAASWWWNVALNQRANGDRTKAFRDFPQKEEHAFLVGDGRWIRARPEVVDPAQKIRVEGVGGTMWQLEVYRRPQDGSGQYLIGVDTSTGQDLDRSVAVVIDKEDQQICACFVDGGAAADNLAIAARELQRLYTWRPGADTYEVERVPICLVEVNGYGYETARQIRNLGGTVKEITTTAASKYSGLLKARQGVEAGRIYGPMELLKESDSLHLKNERFHGLKDLVMSIGFCLNHLERAPFEGPEPRRDLRIYKLKPSASAGAPW